MVRSVKSCGVRRQPPHSSSLFVNRIHHPPTQSSRTQPRFFGLTALGAPDPYHGCLLDTVTSDIFDDADVAAAFKKVSNGDLEGFELVRSFMEALFHGEFPEQELKQLIAILKDDEGCDVLAGDSANGEQIARGMATLQSEGERYQKSRRYDSGSGSEFQSNQLYREHRFRHMRYKQGPAEK